MANGLVYVLWRDCGWIPACRQAGARTPSRRLGWKQSSSLRAIQQAQWRRADGFIRWDNLRLIGEIQIWLETRHKIYALL